MPPITEGVAAPLVVLNPTASRIVEGRRRGRLLAELDRAVRARTGRAPEVLATASLDDARRAFGEAAAIERPLVVAVGGDGTVREAATCLAGTAVPLAIVPAGTANLFAATVGVPREPDRAAATIATGRVLASDLGRVRWGRDDPSSAADGASPSDQVFAVACGVGFDARLMASTPPTLKRWLGRYGYFATAAGLLPRVGGFDCSIELDGERLELRALEVLIANSGDLLPGLLGPRLAIDPLDDRLDVFIVEGRNVVDGTVGALEAIGRRSLGRSRTGRSRRYRARRIVIRPRTAQPFEIDGDVHGTGWLEATSLPGSLRVLVPG